MYADEVIIKYVKCDAVLMVGKRFAKCVCLARKPAIGHAHSQERADVLRAALAMLKAELEATEKGAAVAARK